MVRVENDFNSSFKNMKNELRQDGFHIAGLCANMRNSKQIAQVGVKYSSDVLRMNKAIPTLPSATVVGPIPRVISLDYHECDKRLVPAIQHGFDLLNENFRASCVILHTRHFNSNDIRKKLQEKFDNENNEKGIDIFPPQQKDNSASMELPQFLGNPNNILVTNAKYFIGCEAPNVIFCISDDDYDTDFYDYTDAARCNLMRAVSNLIIINVIKNSSFQYTFDGAVVEPKTWNLSF